MPDESCRRCGGLLIEFEICGKCRAPTSFMCRICATKTEKKIHDSICFKVDEPFPIHNSIGKLAGQA